VDKNEKQEKVVPASAIKRGNALNGMGGIRKRMKFAAFVACGNPDTYSSGIRREEEQK
jgi:hypothetical protein